MATPIDTGGSSSAGTVVTRWYVHTLVSVGPYRLAYSAPGTSRMRWARWRVGNTSPAKRIRRSDGSAPSAGSLPRSTSIVSSDGTA